MYHQSNITYIDNCHHSSQLKISFEYKWNQQFLKHDNNAICVYTNNNNNYIKHLKEGH